VRGLPCRVSAHARHARAHTHTLPTEDRACIRVYIIYQIYQIMHRDIYTLSSQRGSSCESELRIPRTVQYPQFAEIVLGRWVFLVHCIWLAMIARAHKSCTLDRFPAWRMRGLRYFIAVCFSAPVMDNAVVTHTHAYAQCSVCALQ
jgi:hypothetical protein